MCVAGESDTRIWLASGVSRRMRVYALAIKMMIMPSVPVCLSVGCTGRA